MTAINLKNFSSINTSQLMTSVLPALATVVLTIIIANTFASLTWKFVPSLPNVAAPILVDESLKSTQTRAVTNTNNTYKQLPNWHLFGVVQKNVPKAVVQPTPVAPKEAPDTQLRLTLKGVMASPDMMDAWAIVADRMGNEDSYGVDSNLPGGAILKEIYSDRIILEHNGRLETLRLPKTDATGNKSISSSGTNNRRSGRRNTRASNKSTRSVQPRGNVNRVSSAGSAVLKGYRDKLLSDPQSVMNTVRAEPYRQAGKLKGYRIFPGRDKSLFGQLGLEPGDVVTTVNGIDLDSPLKGLEVMQNVTDASEVSVEVLRNGVNQTFLVPMN